MAGARSLIGAVLFLLGMASAVLTLRLTRAYAVEGDSMLPTLRDGDYVQGLRLPSGRAPNRGLRDGAIVVARRPDRPELAVIKRVAGRDPDGRVRLSGDNPAASTDSRHFGSVAPASVDSVIWLRYWPPHRIRLLAGPYQPAPPDWRDHVS